MDLVFDITGKNPVQTQALPIANTYSGIVFNPNGKEFYVTGGVDDLLHTYTSASGKWAEISTGVTLHHTAGIGLETKPEAAGVGITAQGDRLVIANYENDIISVLYRAKGGWTKTAEVDLRPNIADPANAHGVPGGEFPYWVTVKGNDTAYISGVRDREIVVVTNLQSSTPSIVTRIKLPGQPHKMVMTADGSKLYVAQDNSDSVAVINTASDTVEDEIAVTAPLAVYPNKKGFRGVNPNGLALSPDEKTLYVTNGGENAVAVVSLSGVAGNSQVTGLLPTGCYPNSVSTGGDGAFLYKKALHDAQWWAKQTMGMDFSVEDYLDTPKCNRVLWQGTMGNDSYPTVRSGMDLRQNREQLLEQNRRQAATPATAAGTVPGWAYVLYPSAKPGGPRLGGVLSTSPQASLPVI